MPEPVIDFEAQDIFAALHEGRTTDARRLIADYFRRGGRDKGVILIAANMIDPRAPKRGRGAPRKQSPEHWVNIGTDYKFLRSESKKRDESIAMLAKKYGQSPRRIEQALAYYNQAERLGREIEQKEYYFGGMLPADKSD